MFFFTLSASANAPQDPVHYSENYVIQYPAEVPKRLEFTFPPSSTWCSCVNGAKWRVGASGTWGNARDIIPNALKARPGIFMLTNEGNGHITYIEAIEGDTAIISETNYVPCKFTIRRIPLNSDSIRGYFTGGI